MRTCPLCGYEFDASGLTCHTSCPMSKNCHIICCPNCGYQVPDESQMRVASTLQRWWERWRAGRETQPRDTNLPQPLTSLRAGQVAEVASIESLQNSHLAHLSAFGLVPGCKVTLRQRSPAYVLAVDETEVALDRAVAQSILVWVK